MHPTCNERAVAQVLTFPLFLYPEASFLVIVSTCRAPGLYLFAFVRRASHKFTTFLIFNLHLYVT